MKLLDWVPNRWRTKDWGKLAAICGVISAIALPVGYVVWQARGIKEDLVKKLDVNEARAEERWKKFEGFPDIIATLQRTVQRLDETIKDFQKVGVFPTRRVPLRRFLSVENYSKYLDKEGRFRCSIPETLNAGAIHAISADFANDLPKSIKEIPLALDAELSADKKSCLVQLFGDQKVVKDFLDRGERISIIISLFMTADK